MEFRQLFRHEDLDRLGPPGPEDAGAALGLLREHEIRFLQLQYTDIFGNPKGLEVPASGFERTLEGKLTFDGSSVDGRARVEELEMILRPDLSTLRLLPWDADARVARLICDVTRYDGTPFDGDPRGALERILALMSAEGYRPKIGIELEFFLFQAVDGATPAQPLDDAGYFDLAPLDRGLSMRRDLLNVLDAMGVEVLTAHHEVAPGQCKIALAARDALGAADGVTTLKIAARNVAARHGLRAEFIPKPFFGQNGAGMHTHHSLMRDGGNVFHDPDTPDGLSDTLRFYMGGLMHHARGYCAITNPVVNSYKRLVPGFEAPIGVSWSLQNRSPLLRVPTARGENTRCELRLPDPSCNPYLALAVQLAAAMDGLRHEIEPGDPVAKNLWDLNPRERARLEISELPHDLGEALVELGRDRVVRRVLGEYIFSHFSSAKRTEWAEFNSMVHPWELARYAGSA